MYLVRCEVSTGVHRPLAQPEPQHQIHHWRGECLALLDTNRERKEDGTIKVAIYHKSTHTYKYLNFSANHPLNHKLNGVQILHHRSRQWGWEQQRLSMWQRLSKTVTTQTVCWEERQPHPKNEWTRHTQKEEKGNSGWFQVPLPYIKGLSEEVRITFRSYGCDSYIKPRTTLSMAITRYHKRPSEERREK